MNTRDFAKRLVILTVLGVLAACSGGGSNPPPAPPPPPPPPPPIVNAIVPRFAYVANVNDNSVSVYEVDAVTGQLRARGHVAAGTFPRSVTVDPSGKFAYVANGSANNVSAGFESA